MKKSRFCVLMEQVQMCLSEISTTVLSPCFGEALPGILWSGTHFFGALKDQCQAEHFLFELGVGAGWDWLPGVHRGFSSLGAW